MRNFYVTASKRMFELLECTVVNFEMCSLLKDYGLATSSEVEELALFVNQKLNTQAASYLYKTLLPKFGGVKESEDLFVKVLKEGCNQSALLILLYDPGDDECPKLTPKGTIAHEIPQCDGDFTGRSKELSELHTWHTQNQTIYRKPILVNGLGGIGKTSLVRMFVQKIEKTQMANIIWLKSGRLDISRSISSFLKKYCPQNLSAKQDPTALGKFVFQICQSQPTLLIIDNLEELDEELRFICSPCEFLSVIVTSRDKGCLDGQIFSLNILSLAENDATELFQKLLTRNICTKDVPSLCKTLQNFPLGLIEVSNYIGKKNITRSNYNIYSFLDEFKCVRKQKKILSDFLPNEKKSNCSCTFITWDKTIEYIRSLQNEESKLALLLLKILSFGKCQEVQEDDFSEMSEIGSLVEQGVWNFIEAGFSDTEFCMLFIDEGLELLARFSFLEYQEKLDCFQVHKILQTVTRLKNLDNWRPSETFRSANKAVADKLKWEFPTHQCPHCRGRECSA